MSLETAKHRWLLNVLFQAALVALVPGTSRKFFNKESS